MKKQCTHLSRQAAMALANHDHCALISLRDPDSYEPTFASKFRDVLLLAFHDISNDYPYLTARWGLPDEYDQSMIVPNIEHARKIAEFIRKNWDVDIIVHCEAGISRSAAVCEVLVELGWNYVVPAIPTRRFANRLLVNLLKGQFDLERSEIQNGEMTNEKEADRSSGG